MKDPTDDTVVTLLPLHEVERRVGFRRTTIRKLRLAGEFPDPIQIGPRMVRWRSDVIDAWIDDLSARAGSTTERA